MPTTRQIKNFYTDGACSCNPGPGGWGTVVYFNDGSVYEMGGGEKLSTTNNRMELLAAIEALKVLKASGQNQPVSLYTDSQYVIDGITKWIKGWKKKGWKTAAGKAVLNQDLWETLDQLNSPLVDWQHVRGHSGNEGNERCDAIARAFSLGKPMTLEQAVSWDSPSVNVAIDLPVARVSDKRDISELNYNTTQLSVFTSDVTIMDSQTPSPTGATDDLPREVRVAQLRNLVETLRIADEVASEGYLISSSELADLMDVNASAVTSRGDNWPWRNWIVSRVRREGNQILWQLERVDQVNAEEE